MTTKPLICRICQNTENQRSFTAREMMFGLRDEFPYFECSACGCVQIQEIPSNLPKYYPDNYYSFQKQGWLKSALKRRWAAYSFTSNGIIGRTMSTVLGKNQGIESVKRAGASRNAAILDIGCGSGDLLLLLHSLGFTNLTGADPFITADISYDNGIKVWKKELSAISQTYDLIMLHHSFEHMLNPVEIMAQAKRLLKPSGELIIRVPVAASYSWKTYGINWVQLDAPRHIFLPTVKGIEALAKKIGLRLSKVVHESDEFQFWGSEQYVRGIPLFGEGSMLPLWKRALARGTIQSYRQRAAELNAKGEGDSVCFHLNNAA